MNTSKNNKQGSAVKKQRVQDDRGTVYELSEKEAKTEFAKLMGVNHES